MIPRHSLLPTLAFVFALGLLGRPAGADHGACACQATFDPCLIGQWQVDNQSLLDYWQDKAAQVLGLQVRSTDGQVLLTVQADSAFAARIDLSSRSSAAGNVEVASRVTGAPSGRVCVVPRGQVCSNQVDGTINVQNWLKVSGQSVPTPKLAFPAARERENHGRALAYRCQGDRLEVTFDDKGEKRVIRAQRR